MEILKKILTGMIILLVVIVVGGGFYLASMGGMDHGKTAVNNSTEKQNSDNSQKANASGDAANNQGSLNHLQEQVLSPTGTDSTNQKAEQGQQPAGQQPADQQTGNGGTGMTPVIIQVQPPKTDPGVYVDQIKEKLRSINDTNSSIASNSGAHGSQNGNTSAPMQGDMNELHRDFYKLGKDVAAMEQSLDKLSTNLRDNQSQQFNYNYPYAGYPNNTYQYPNYPYNPNQQGQTVQPSQNSQQPDNSNNQPGNTTGNSSHSVTNDQMNHGFSLGNLVNSDSAKTIFTLMLLGSVILAIISVVGFLVSLFKQGTDRPGINDNTSV